MYIILCFYYFTIMLFHNKKLILVMNTLVFTLFWGLRYDVGIDYLQYENFFLEKNYYGELGYKLIVLLVDKLHGEFFFVTLMSSFLTIITN